MNMVIIEVENMQKVLTSKAAVCFSGGENALPFLLFRCGTTKDTLRFHYQMNLSSFFNFFYAIAQPFLFS